MNNKQLLTAIMEHWTQAAIEGTVETDYQVNNLIDDYAFSIGIDQRKLEGDVFTSVSNMTTTQKRTLHKMLLSSGILE